jgi:hypothetical protein
MKLDLNEKEIEVFNNRVNYNYELAESNGKVVKVVKGILNKLK